MLLQQNKVWIRSVAEKLQLIFTCLFVSTLCFRRDLNQSFLIAALFFSLPLINTTLIRERWRVTLMMILVYVVAAVSTLYSPHKKEALFVLEKQLTLFIVPLIFAFSFRVNYAKLRIVLWCFISSVFLVCLYLLARFHYMYVISRGYVTVQEFLLLNLHHNYSIILDFHATYLSMYVCFSFAASVYMFFHEKKLLRIVALLFIPLFLFSLLMLSSRIVFLPFFIIVLFVVPFFIRWQATIVYFVILFSGMAVTYNYLGKYEAFRNRFKEDTMRELNITNGFSFGASISTDDATRAERWKCAVELVRERPLAGYGTGEEKFMLSQKYSKYNLSNSLHSNFDAHNQFLAFTIKSGIIGLASFLCLLAVSFFRAFRHRNYYFICFLLIVTATSLTENILESNKGILFFAVFNTLFILVDDRLQPVNKQKLPLPQEN
jgi:O-antigen ligase